jgi:hypothetical protein
MKKCCILVAVFVVVFALMSISFAASDKEKLVGMWKLVTIEDPNPDPEAPDINPAGYIVYDAGGRMAFQMTKRPDRPKFTSGKVTAGVPEEFKAAFIGYGAYYGSYEVDEKSRLVIHHVEGNLFPNNVGAENLRYYEFSGDNRLTLFVSSRKDGKILPKNASGRRLIWDRVK